MAWRCDSLVFTTVLVWICVLAPVKLPSIHLQSLCWFADARPPSAQPPPPASCGRMPRDITRVRSGSPHIWTCSSPWRERLLPSVCHYGHAAWILKSCPNGNFWTKPKGPQRSANSDDVSWCFLLFIKNGSTCCFQVVSAEPHGQRAFLQHRTAGQHRLLQRVPRHAAGQTGQVR